MALKLGDIPLIANSLKFGTTQSVKLLNIVLGNTTFDRFSRKNLRNFTSFPADFDLNLHKTTLLKDFSLSDFQCVANFLHLEDYGDTSEIVCDSIITALTNLSNFQSSIDDSFLSDSENEIPTNSEIQFSHTANANDAANVGHMSHPMNVSPAINSTQIQTVPSSDSNYIFPSHPAVTDSAVDINNQFWFLLRDLSNTCRNFSGNDNYSIRVFFNDIEDTFALFPNLTHQQKLIFAKRLIVGPAKTFLFSQQNLNSYDAFKTALINEFSDTITSIEIHRLLEKRKMRSNETLNQYFLVMRELANRSDSIIDESSVIQYTIQGIQGAPSEKIVLYGATSYSEFTKKLKIYETIISTTHANTSNFRHPNDGQRRGTEQKNFYQRRESQLNVTVPSKSKKCFNCNDFGHFSKSCPNRSRGPKCLACGCFGHKSNQCQRSFHNENSTPQDAVHTVQVLSSPENMCKNTVIFGHTFSGLVDTGSNLTLLQKSAYIKIGSPPLVNTAQTLTGFGFSRTKVIGSFDADITIDSQIFPVTISVIPDNCMNYDLILGSDVIKQANLSITPDGILFSKISQTSHSFEPENFTMTISVDPPQFDIGPNVSNKTRNDVERLALAYKPHKIKTTNVELDITLTDDTPISHTPRRLPFVERGIVDAQVTEWLNNGIVEPCSSPYSSQVVVVRKKCGKPRVCIDYRKLNRKLIKDHYPLPLIDDVLDQLQNATIFTTLDLRNGFFHVPVNEKSRFYTSFVTHSGQYRFRFMPFGLSNCPAVFMRYINSVFRDLIASGIVLPYMDDLIIPAKNETQALERLKTVFSIARDYGLEINFNKCQFLHNKIEFLGHVVENGKLFPSPSKTKAVLNYPDLKNTQDVRRFLGLSGYFRKFIPKYSTIAKPLSDLLRKDTPFQFKADQKAAFQQLKYLLSQQPVLSIFNQNSPLEIHTDASIDGLGAVLLQQSMDDNQFHPIFYMSKKTSDNERKYTSFELEVLAIVEALKKFRIYVLGSHFKIFTDCYAVEKTLQKKEINTKIARWALYLQDYDYELHHRTGSKMAHVDALSRNPTCFIIQDGVISQFLKAQNTDEHIGVIKSLLQNSPYDDYIIKNDLLYKTINGVDLIVVPEDMQANIIKTAHERGHFALVRTQEILNKEYFIPNLKEKIERCIHNCVTCILSNKKRGKQDGFLHPIEKDDTPLHTYHIDHLGPLASTSKQYKHILSVIDSFTKFVWLYPTKSTDANEVINRLETQSSVFGNPARIISDKGPAFTSAAFKDYCEKQKIHHVPITTGLPRSNGQVERLNSTIISALTKISINKPEHWYRHVPHVQQIINSTFHRSINSTPFELLIGTPIKSQHDTHLVDIIHDEIKNSFVQQRQDLRKDAKRQISKVQEENCRSFNRRRKQAQTFQLGDLVAIKRTQYGPGLKLKIKFLGPYKVIKVKPNNTYDVEKCSFFDGPSKTSTCAEFMKPWSNSSPLT